MRLSTKGRYGLRAVVDLAMYSQDEAISINSIAARQNLSESYLEQLIAKLKKAGLVNSIRGINGGYILAKKPKDISVGDILRALEGDLAVVECPDSDSECAKYDSCVTKYVWKRINDSINTVVDSMTLEEIVENSHKLEKYIPSEDEGKAYNC